MHFHVGRSSTNSSSEGSKSKVSSPTDDPPSYSQSESDSRGSYDEMTQTSKTGSPITGSMFPFHNMINNSMKGPQLQSTQSKNSIRSNSRGTSSNLNKPYVPSQEQQKQIDLLGKTSSNADISQYTSNTQTDYFDVLPSFQMFQSILKRDDSQFSENLTIDPPMYGDTLNSSPSPRESLTPLHSYSGNNLDSMMSEVNQRLNHTALNEEHEDFQGYQFSDNDSADGLVPTSSTDSRNNPHISTSYDSYGHTVLDNIDRLPKLKLSPIDIQIYVTKRVPQPHCANEVETRLKEYTSGDIVNGYIVITNTSDKPIDFGLFLVTLEGTIKTVQRIPNSDLHLGYKYDKILMKKFLKMYDLNASYGYTDVPSSAGIEYTAYTLDEHDGCVLGLPNERVLQPHSSYKKFFTFKFPFKLLDDNCFNSLVPHTLPPPSMGLDRTCFLNRGSTIQLNKALGYGFLNTRGTPLMTKDYGFEDVSVSYTIEAKFIDKINSNNQKDIFSQHEINDPNSDSEYVISKGNQYFLRFIPDLREQLPYFNHMFSYTNETYGSIGIDGKLYENYVNSSTWKLLNLLNYGVEKEINSKLLLQELGDEGIKNKNLSIGESEVANVNLKDQIAKQLRHLDHLDTTMEEIEYFYDLRMIGSKALSNVFGKKKKTILSSLIKIGESKIYAKVPNKIIPYTAPKLLMRYNTNNFNDDSINPVSTSTSFIKSPSSNEDIPLAPVSSTSSISNHIADLYYRNQDDIIQSVDISLIFLPSDNSSKPPQISYIETNIIFWSYNCDFPLPLELSYDFFYTDPNDEIQSTDDVNITRNNLQSLKDQANIYIQYLRDNMVYVSKDAFLYLKSIKSLGFKKDTIKDYFKTIRHSTHPDLLNNDSDWKIQQSPDKKLKWSKNLTIPLIPINKENVNLIPTFQSCLVGRIYCLQILVKYKGSGGDQNEFADNIVKVDVPILVG